MKVGVLALQGDYSAHARALAARGVETVEVRRAEQLDGADALVLPGGESTTMLKLMAGSRLAEGLGAAVRAGTPLLATCAGLILVAREVLNPSQPSLGLLDVTVERNGYGRQLASAVVGLTVDAPDLLGDTVLEGVFIRAPRIVAVGAGTRVLARRGDEPVLVREGSVLGATFHPELTAASPVLELFVAMVKERS